MHGYLFYFCMHKCVHGAPGYIFAVFAGVLFNVKFLFTGFNLQIVFQVSQRTNARCSHVKSRQ